MNTNNRQRNVTREELIDFYEHLLARKAREKAESSETKKWLDVVSPTLSNNLSTTESYDYRGWRYVKGEDNISPSLSSNEKGVVNFLDNLDGPEGEEARTKIKRTINPKTFGTLYGKLVKRFGKGIAKTLGITVKVTPTVSRTELK